MSKLPTARTLEWCRKQGMAAFVTERWNPHARIRQDALGFIDLIYLDGSKTVAVQATTGDNAAARVSKIKAEPRAREWLDSPHRMIVVHAWRQVGKAGKRKLWTLKEVPVSIDDLDPSTVVPYHRGNERKRLSVLAPAPREVA